MIWSCSAPVSSRGGSVAGLGGAAREHLEGAGRGGAGERPERGHPHAERELVAQARGGRARRREHQHLGGVEALDEDPLGDELPQRRGATPSPAPR